MNPNNPKNPTNPTNPTNPKSILITGGCGFIGTNFIRHTLKTRPDWHIVNLDALTYAGNGSNLSGLPPEWAQRYQFVHGDICDAELLQGLFASRPIDAVIHFAAESHVDRSIHDPGVFIRTNITGTYTLLQASMAQWQKSSNPDAFRFIHVSTDEVYGSLGPTGYFSETTPYNPSSPYSASKAGSDHLVKAWFSTYGLPAVVTNCSNNYGPYQFPEKLIPLMILNLMEGKPLPVYGDGRNVRDWLYVIDHCEALATVLEKGQPGSTYNIGGNQERQNIEIVHLLCDRLDRKLDRAGSRSSRRLIDFVADRPGHDRRYAIDATKIKTDLGWQPTYKIETALEETIDWYLDHMDWVNTVRSGEYRNWLNTNYGNRQPDRAGDRPPQNRRQI
jgi:dTDP-glucose 4,6-dehydratase